MPMAGKGMLLTSMNIDAAHELEFNRWYDREHLQVATPEVRSMPLALDVGRSCLIFIRYVRMRHHAPRSISRVFTFGPRQHAKTSPGARAPGDHLRLAGRPFPRTMNRLADAAPAQTAAQRRTDGCKHDHHGWNLLLDALECPPSGCRTVQACPRGPTWRKGRKPPIERDPIRDRCCRIRGGPNTRRLRTPSSGNPHREPPDAEGSDGSRRRVPARTGPVRRRHLRGRSRSVRGGHATRP